MAKNICVAVNNKIATYIQRGGAIVCGNSDYTITFTFDSEWAAHEVKTARFLYNGITVDVVFEGNIVEVPILRNATSVSVGVFAGNLQTTTPAVIPCMKSILCDDGVPPDPEPDVYAQIMAMLNGGGGGSGGQLPKIGEVTLTAAGWAGEGNLFSQVVTIEGVTENSQVDLTPSVEQLAVFYEKDLTFVTENEDGVVTVYAIGQRPQNDYVIQVTITEVSV